VRTRRGAGSPRPPAARVKTARGRTASSTEWLARQLNDPYVHRARREGFRSRAAYKLAEIDDRFHLLRPGATVVDLGAAPGGWSQVAAARVLAPARGRVVAIDLLAMDPVPGVRVLQMDFLTPEAQASITAALGGRADLVLSDMAAPATGHGATDHVRIVALAEAALEFALAVLAPGGAFIAKVYQGGAESSLLRQLKHDFAAVRHAKPPASRAESAEVYVVATGFRRAE
jgi:23S rRNA (uridine2552-2'-O)-methyltransferase